MSLYKVEWKFSVLGGVGWIGFTVESGNSEAGFSTRDPKMTVSGGLYSEALQNFKRKV